MRNAVNLPREMKTPMQRAAVASERVLRIPGTLACPTSAR